MIKNLLTVVVLLAAIVFAGSGASMPPVAMIPWHDLGKQLTAAGVIDVAKFEALYAERGGLSAMERELLTAASRGRVALTAENAGLFLNLLWAFGLANNNEILKTGPMADPRYGGAENFASTGGWTLAVGDSMDHYSAHSFVTLTPEQQKLVEETSQNIFRPCCRNPAYFPDCNHGMAMLGMLELLAAAGAEGAELYQAAEIANGFWFPPEPTGGGCRA